MTISKGKLKLVFSKYAYERRKAKKLKQQEVATAVGVSLRWIQKIESGKKLPGFHLAVLLIQYLDIDMASLLRALASAEEAEPPREEEPSSKEV